MNSMNRYRIFLSGLVACMICADAAADESKSGLSWEDLCKTTVCRATGHDGVMEVRISARGDRVAMTVQTGTDSEIHLHSLEDETSGHLAEGHSPYWFADGQSIVYIHDSDLWRIQPGSDEPTRLTDDDHDVRAPRPSPDGEEIAFYSSRSGYQDIWLVGRDGNAGPRQLTRSSMSVDEPRFVHAWSPDGSQIAYFSNQAEYFHDDLWAVEVNSGEMRQLSNTFMGRSEPAWSPDGKTIAVYGSDKSGFWYGDLADLYLVDLDSEEERAVEMSVHAMDIDRVVWSADGDSLVFPVHERGEIELWRVPASGGVATRMTHEGGVIHGFDGNGDAFVMARSTAARGREADYLDGAGGPLRQLGELATQWSGLTEPEEISYRSFDGHFIQGFLVKPPDFDPSRSYPSLVQVHGGGTNSYYNGLNLVEQRLARSGYVVLAVNYRGGSGFGRAFQDMAVEDWAGDQALDAAAAADFIRSRPWSDGKVGIYGYSYGGIISLAAVTRAPEAFDAAVPMGGIYDFADAWETADRLGRLFTREGHGGSPEEQPEVYARSDSVARIEQVRTPILIMHGQADERAPYRQYGLVVEALEEHDKTFESHSYPDEPHQFRDLENRVDMYQRLEAWMDRWLKEQ